MTDDNLLTLFELRCIARNMRSLLLSEHDKCGIEIQCIIHNLFKESDNSAAMFQCLENLPKDPYSSGGIKGFIRGCQQCRHVMGCLDEISDQHHFQIIRRKLRNITGIDIDYPSYGDATIPDSGDDKKFS